MLISPASFLFYPGSSSGRTFSPKGTSPFRFRHFGQNGHFKAPEKIVLEGGLLILASFLTFFPMSRISPAAEVALSQAACLRNNFQGRPERYPFRND